MVTTLTDEGPGGFNYKLFCDPEEVEVYVRVKRRTMRLARAGREVAASMVGGVIGDGERSGKEFVRTHLGLYRLATSDNADNTTEAAVHARMGIRGTVCMGDWAGSMRPWLREHGCPISYDEWMRRVIRELRSME